jgi:SAM-dependent methyltransferase
VSARRGQARHAAPAGPLPEDDRGRLPGKVGDALRQRVLSPGRRRGQDTPAEPDPPGDVSYEPPPTPAYRPDPPPPAFRSEPPPAFRPEPPSAPAFRSEPSAAPAFRSEPSAAPAFRREAAPAVETRETWVRRGQAQFDYLIGHGLQPGDRMLEIGCGTLRAGHLFIDYLSTGHYYGVDTSPDALIAAQRIVAEFGLQAKMPHLTLVSGLDLRFLPASKFTVVQAHNLFGRSPTEVIGEGFAQVSRVMTRDAIFDFTFDRADGVEPQALRKDFYRRADTLIGLADAHGFDAELMKDWEPFGHGHSKLRLIRRG